MDKEGSQKCFHLSNRAHRNLKSFVWSKKGRKNKEEKMSINYVFKKYMLFLKIVKSMSSRIIVK